MLPCPVKLRASSHLFHGVHPVRNHKRETSHTLFIKKLEKKDFFVLLRWSYYLELRSGIGQGALIRDEGHNNVKTRRGMANEPPKQ